MGAAPASPEPCPIAVRSDRGTATVAPAGDLDITCADRLDREVRALRRSGVEHVVIDLSGVQFMDSTGLRTLLSLRNDARRDRQRLTLTPGSAQVQRLFDLTTTRTLFDWEAPQGPR